MILDIYKVGGLVFFSIREAAISSILALLRLRQSSASAADADAGFTHVCSTSTHQTAAPLDVGYPRWSSMALIVR